jgi:hypothetical protein
MSTRIERFATWLRVAPVGAVIALTSPATVDCVMQEECDSLEIDLVVCRAFGDRRGFSDAASHAEGQS